MMKNNLTFNDVLITPKFSYVRSRKDVDLSTSCLGMALPIMSSNMKTLTESDMAIVMAENGGLGVLHRFCSVQENVDILKATLSKVNRVAVSFGSTKEERERAAMLYNYGARIFVLDVAQGANIQVVEQVEWFRTNFPNNFLIVGNFATSDSIAAFEYQLNQKNIDLPDLYKVGIGGGANCVTREKTGVGIPQLSAIIDCAQKYPIIADGGMSTPGDIAKALGAGAKMVMLGSMLAATKEAAAPLMHKIDEKYFKATLQDDIVRVENGLSTINKTSLYKEHSGSAATGYAEGYRTSEGVSVMLPYRGSVVPILKDIEGGLRSALTYTNSRNLEEFRDNVRFIEVSNSTKIENGAHIL